MLAFAAALALLSLVAMAAASARIRVDWRGTPRGFAPRPALRSAELGPWDPSPAWPAPLRSPGADRPTEFRGLSAPTWPAVPTARPPRIERRLGNSRRREAWCCVVVASQTPLSSGLEFLSRRIMTMRSPTYTAVQPNMGRVEGSASARASSAKAKGIGRLGVMERTRAAWKRKGGVHL